MYLDLDFYPSAIIFFNSFSTSAIGTSPSKGSSSVPNFDFTLSYIYFISIILKSIYLFKKDAISVFPDKDIPIIMPNFILFPIFSLKREDSHLFIVFNLNSF
jgi:hypothetical protein